MDSSSRHVLFWGISFTSIAAAVFYLLFRKDEEKGITASRPSEIKVKVPNEFMGTIIGKKGCTIKAIQEKTGARIDCNDAESSNEYRVITIRGASECAQLAESMIHEIIMNQPLIITHEMWVPSRACGRIIGKGGETIRLITFNSCAKIIVDNAGVAERAADRRVLLKGTAEQINQAKLLIEEKVKEDEDFRHRLEMSAANRSPRREPRAMLNQLMAPSDDQDEQPLPCRTERFNEGGSENFFTVFVSASTNPGQFWVQLVNPRGVELDQLIEKMTEYYAKPENRELHTLGEINVGQIVAAPFDHDDKWYRAEILKIDENEYDPTETKVTLYYGDYGDNCIVKRKCLLDLRTDFLTLYFQAIECTLAHVVPHGEEWSDEAINLFEELAEVALWQKKLAHVVTYRESVHKEGKRAGSPVPVIELHDKKLNIGDELVKQGFAVWESDVTNGANASEPVSSPLSGEKVLSSSQIIPPEPLSLFEPGSSSDSMKASNPIKMAPPAVFGMESNVPISKNSKSLDSSLFIAQEKSKQDVQGFKPRTLEKQRKSKPVEVLCLPELFSDEDSDDGFSLG